MDMATELTINGKKIRVAVDYAHIKAFGDFGDIVQGAPRFTSEELEKIISSMKAMDIKTVGISLVKQTFPGAKEENTSIILSFPKSGYGVILAPNCDEDE